MPTIELSDTLHDDFHAKTLLPQPSHVCPVCSPEKMPDDYDEAVRFLATAVKSGSPTAVRIGSWWVANVWDGTRQAPHELSDFMPCVWCHATIPNEEHGGHATDCSWVEWFTTPTTGQ
jgi:hypothetical protein